MENSNSKLNEERTTREISVLKRCNLRSKKWAKELKENAINCAYCYKPFTGHRSVKTFDHVTPLSQGGSNRIGNILIACKKCNGKKGREDLRRLKRMREY